MDEEPLQYQPLSYNFQDVASNLRATNPSKKQVYSAFSSLGYKLCQTYYSGDLWKTDAPPEVIYDIFKKWKEETTPDTYLTNVPEGNPARIILNKPRQVEADFNY